MRGRTRPCAIRTHGRVRTGFCCFLQAFWCCVEADLIRTVNFALLPLSRPRARPGIRVARRGRRALRDWLTRFCRRRCASTSPVRWCSCLNLNAFEVWPGRAPGRMRPVLLNRDRIFFGLDWLTVGRGRLPFVSVPARGLRPPAVAFSGRP